MKVNLPNSGKTVIKFKNDITDALLNIHNNCKVITSTYNCPTTIDITNELQVDILNIIEWYKKCVNKIDILLYLRDYQLMDNRFNNILKKLDTEYDYFLCLIENRFKLIYKESG